MQLAQPRAASAPHSQQPPQRETRRNLVLTVFSDKNLAVIEHGVIEGAHGVGSFLGCAELNNAAAFASAVAAGKHVGTHDIAGTAEVVLESLPRNVPRQIVNVQLAARAAAAAAHLCSTAGMLSHVAAKAAAGRATSSGSTVAPALTGVAFLPATAVIKRSRHGGNSAAAAAHLSSRTKIRRPPRLVSCMEPMAACACEVRRMSCSSEPR